MMTSDQLLAKCQADGEFLLMCRHWNGGFIFEIDDEVISIKIEDGKPVAGQAEGDVLTFKGPKDLWEPLFMALPPRFFNDIAIGVELGIEREGDDTLYAQYYPAVMRAVELMRPENKDQAVTVDPPYEEGDHEEIIGKYVYIEINGLKYRIYYEEAGSGIPLLCHHTAGAHGTQWRHILTTKEITDNFRVIAYDIPYHGKSIPPTQKKWWQEQYELTADFVRQIPIKIADALCLEKPLFMGCSVGGALALDLAVHHPEHFRGVISVEGALYIGGDRNDHNHKAFYHPQVSNEFKSRLMHALTSPTSPEAYRRETIQGYASGWPQAFIGDLKYYVEDFDITQQAGDIDTSKISVTIMNGEYDFSGNWELGEAASQAIEGSKWIKMNDVGHFPMSENPEAFVKYLMPVLEEYLNGTMIKGADSSENHGSGVLDMAKRISVKLNA